MALDARAEKVADIVLDYSVELQKEDRLVLQFDPAHAETGFMFGKKAVERGAAVMYDAQTFDSQYIKGLLTRNSPSEWQEDFGRRKGLAEWCNSRVMLYGAGQEDYVSGVPEGQERLAKYTAEVIGPYKKILYRKGENGKPYAVKWNIVGIPTPEAAREANMSLSEYTDFVYSAILTPDWRKTAERMQKIKERIDGSESIRVIVPGHTDISMSLRGRGAEVCDGHFNMPDGEIFYGPVEDSANGHIYFQPTAIREGYGSIEGIRLEFREGKVVNASARKNESSLLKILDTDAGARGLGELGIGCNFGVKSVTGNLLFDEKIGGTVHLALGESFDKQPLSNGGGKNDSSVHWDIVCDLRRDSKNLAEYPGGEIYIGGQLIQKNGEWLI